jgi:phosphoenolpyruvate carboxykinase (diphosphate)
VDHTFGGVMKRLWQTLRPPGRGLRHRQALPDIYLRARGRASTSTPEGHLEKRGRGRSTIPLQPGITYVLPSGYKVEMVKPSAGMRWRLIGTTAEGTFCHKPCTVSGGGKSEISKSISDAMITARCS